MVKEKVRILSFHPFSLYSNGGGSRILRRLYEGHENEIICMVLQENIEPVKKGETQQVVIKQFPLHRSWYKWYLRKITFWLRNKGLRFQTIRKIRAAEKNIDYDIIHVVNHGLFSAALFPQIVSQKKEVWASFHDYFSACGGTFRDAEELWKLADRRFVISYELGITYSKLFGSFKYEIVTDGLYKHEISPPLISAGSPDVLRIYFAGLLHLDYLPLIKVLADALDLLASEGYKIQLLLRGTQKVNFLNDRKFKVIYKPVSLDSDELKSELDNATILYLPIKFTDTYFYLYSLSTKMVGYLGGGGAILYHGPVGSAAYNLLHNNECTASCTTLKVEDMLAALDDTVKNCSVYSANAKKLAHENFLLSTFQRKFWQN